MRQNYRVTPTYENAYQMGGNLPTEWSKHTILVKPARPRQIVDTLAKVVGGTH